MKKSIPVKLRKSEYKFDAEWLEGLLQAPINIPEFKPMWSEILDKERNKHDVLIRSIKEEEIDPVLSILQKFLFAEYDYYDIVGARVFAELLAIKRKRMKDEYFFLGLENGVPVGIANGRILNEKVNISLHTMAFLKQVNAGAVLYYAKNWYAFEICNNEEFWATFESYNGWRLGALWMAMHSYPWPEYQHELGGATVFYLSKKQWEEEVKENYLPQIARTFFKPAPQELIEKNDKLVMPKDEDLEI
jgi:hypothetical protein